MSQEIEFTKHLVTGDLVEGGAQYSAAVDTTTADTDVTVFSVTVDSPVLNIPRVSKFYLWELEVSLVCELRAVSTATADLKWKWQVRNKDGTWADLMGDYVTETNINTTYVSQFVGRYPTIGTSTVNELPFDLRLLLQCNELNEGRGRVANTSYVAGVASRL